MGGLVFSQKTLLALTQAGISREDSYRIVQRNAMKVWESRGKQNLLDFLKSDPDVKIAPAELDKIFTYDDYIRNIAPVMDRLFSK